mmetsp:Transcript_130273/g.253729  ORF Transcript_130273/g.253729 Transcript_130273/m.253729 type:complete len:247 (-) Transcript_130273:119-859(-)
MGADQGKMPGEDFLLERELFEHKLACLFPDDTQIVRLVVESKPPGKLDGKLDVETDEGIAVGKIIYDGSRSSYDASGYSLEKRVFLDTEGCPLGVMSRSTDIGTSYEWFLYGTRPRLHGQQPSKEGAEAAKSLGKRVHFADGAQFYDWASIKDKKMSPMKRFGQDVKVKMANGCGGYSPTDRYFACIYPERDVAVTRQEDKGGACLAKYSSVYHNTQTAYERYELSVAPGIDPALMVCIIAFCVDV